MSNLHRNCPADPVHGPQGRIADRQNPVLPCDEFEVHYRRKTLSCTAFLKGQGRKGVRQDRANHSRGFVQGFGGVDCNTLGSVEDLQEPASSYVSLASSVRDPIFGLKYGGVTLSNTRFLKPLQAGETAASTYTIPEWLRLFHNIFGSAGEFDVIYGISRNWRLSQACRISSPCCPQSLS